MARKPQKRRTTKVRKTKARVKPPVNVPPLAMSVDEWCEAYRVKKNTFYEMLKQGTGPPTILLGRRRIITIEASMEWQRLREREAVTTSVVTEAA